VDQPRLAWQSTLILLLVLPATATDVVFSTAAWIEQSLPVALWTLLLSSLLGILAWKMRSATPSGALTGTMVTASLILSTASLPFAPWRNGLMPVLTVLILTSISTRLGRRRKEQLGTAESRTGRKASQVAANIGAAALLGFAISQTWMLDNPAFHLPTLPHSAVFIAGLASLCEAAADTVSSELGQVLNSRPRLLTTLRVVEPGTDGAISLGGTLAGVVAACIVALAGSAALHGNWLLFSFSWAGGVFGLFFDSLLGATFERSGWLNNDAVNFLSTCSAAVFALVLLASRASIGLP
jgi:uncharacterized protein (TIGR00297 family)